MGTQIPEGHLDALRIITDKLNDTDVRWALTGSLNLAIQGVDIEVGDIDIITDREGAYRINELLKDYETQAVCYGESAHFRSYFGMFSVLGVQVEVMGDFSHDVQGAWSEPSSPEGSIQLEWAGMIFPALPLEKEYEEYLNMGRGERAALIRDRIESV